MGHVGAKMANKTGEMANKRCKMGAKRRTWSGFVSWEEFGRCEPWVLSPLKGLKSRSIEALKLDEYTPSGLRHGGGYININLLILIKNIYICIYVYIHIHNIYVVFNICF